MIFAKFSCTVSTTDSSAPLGFELWFDDHMIFHADHVIESTQIQHEFDDTDAQHELRWILKNKQAAHTIIDADGIIVSDARLVLSNIVFEDIDCVQITQDNAVYTHNFNGHGPDTAQQFYGEIGCNGTVSLKFTTPVYLWLLENM